MRDISHRQSRVSAALRLLRLQTMYRSLRGRLDGARWQLWMGMLTSAIMWLWLLAFCLWGFHYVFNLEGISRYIIESVIDLMFNLFFSTLFLMLIFSTGIILYAGLFSSEQSRSMLVRPIAPDQVFAFKFQEALLFSSWGFLVLSSPALISFGIAKDASWTYYLLGTVYVAFFSFLSGSIGALFCLLVSWRFPRNKKELGIATAIVLIAFGIFKLIQAWQQIRGDQISQTSLMKFLAHLRLSNLPLAPSRWMSTGIQAAADTTGDGQLTRSMLYLLVVVSNALIVYLMTAAAYRVLYRTAYDRVHSQSFVRRRSERNYSSAALEKLFFFLPLHLRALTIKDVKTFLRDPLQFLQVAILTGLLLVYIISLGTSETYAENPYLKSMIGLLNIAVMSLFLNVFSSRFVFPLLSLEGQKMWILGLCPVSRDAILWSKFAFSAAGSCLLLLTLTVLSVLMLRLDPIVAGMQFLLIPVLCCGVSGISVGFGARFADLKQTDPSKIAAGLAGTLNLGATLLFIALAIGAIALPCHVYALQQMTASTVVSRDVSKNLAAVGMNNAQLIPGISPAVLVAIGMAVSLALGIVATWLPMRIGIRAFRKMEV